MQWLEGTGAITLSDNMRDNLKSLEVPINFLSSLLKFEENLKNASPTKEVIKSGIKAALSVMALYVLHFKSLFVKGMLMHAYDGKTGRELSKFVINGMV